MSSSARENSRRSTSNSVIINLDALLNPPHPSMTHRSPSSVFPSIPMSASSPSSVASSYADASASPTQPFRYTLMQTFSNVQSRLSPQGNTNNGLPPMKGSGLPSPLAPHNKTINAVIRLLRSRGPLPIVVFLLGLVIIAVYVVNERAAARDRVVSQQPHKHKREKWKFKRTERDPSKPLIELPIANPPLPPKRVPLPDPFEGTVFENDAQKQAARAAMVKQEMKSAWEAYSTYAWGKDELKPVTKRWSNWGAAAMSKGFGLTAVDSLSTLWLMGMREEFAEAVRLVTEEVDWNQKVDVSVFEFTIRVIGGLLSAYELSGEVHPKLLTTARKVMDKLLVAYNTSTGLPVATANLKTGYHYGIKTVPDASILSEFGTVQLELRTLSYHTKNPVYDIKATHISDILADRCHDTNGLCPLIFGYKDAEFKSYNFGLGANGDSYYEYLVKQYILTGKTEERYKRLSLDFLDEALVSLLGFTEPNKYAYFDHKVFERLGRGGDANVNGYNTAYRNKMDHLSCFAAGMYALAADTFPDNVNAPIYREVAARVTETCNMMYTMQPTGLCPEDIRIVPDGRDVVPGTPLHLQRPEAIESMFYQWRYTRDPKYRDMAWDIFVSLVKYSKVSESGGYTGLRLNNIEHPLRPPRDDVMQSFFLAETLKYLYLIFSEDDALDLNEWVLNTEAHPLKIRNRDPMDVWRAWEEAHGGQPAHMPPTVDGVLTRTETERMKALRGDRRIVAPFDPKGLPQEGRRHMMKKP